MACPATGADVRPPAIGAAEKQGFDQWLEQVLGSEREVVLAQFQQLISKHLELHHAELIAQVEKQLAMPRSHDLEEIAEDVPQERAGHEAGRWPDTGMQMESKIHAKYGPSKDLASDVKWSRFASSDSSDIQENIASLLPGGGIPSAGFQTANQETDTSIPPSCNAEVDKAPLNKSCPRLPMEMKAKFPSEWADRSPCQKSPYSNEYKSPLRQKLMYRSHRLAAVASQGIEVMEGADFLLRFVNSTWFELVIVLVILLNGVTIALEAQYVGCNVGHTLGYPKYNTSASEEFPWIESTLNVAQIIFNVLFLIELFLRIGAYRLYLCKHPLLVCDMLLILVSGADVVAAGLFLGMNPAAIRCIRLLKLLRMVKILRSISWMNSLFLIIRSMTACVNALLWSLMLLALLQTCVGLGLLQVLHNYLEDTSRDLESRKLVFEYFGTFSRTFVTMYEVSVGNWAPVCRTLMEEVSEWFGLFFHLVQLYTVLCCCECAQGSVYCRNWQNIC